MTNVLRKTLWFFRFFFNDVNVTLSLLKNSDSWSSSMLRVLEQAFFVSRDGGDDVGAWLDGTHGQIEGGSFSRDFPLAFISSKPDCVTHKLQYLYLLLN